jgi:hypothetical protein
MCLKKRIYNCVCPFTKVKNNGASDFCMVKMTGAKRKILPIVLLVTAIGILGVSGAVYAQQYSVVRCEACGMQISPEMQAHIQIKDAQGNSHYACCQGCMLTLLDPKRGYEQLNITTYCDFYGPSFAISIVAKEHGNLTVTTPSTAVILMGGKIVASCANNRIAYNQTAADELLELGFTANTMIYQQHQLPNGTPVVPVAKAAMMMAAKGITYVPPQPIVPVLLAVVGVGVIAVSVVGYKKLKPE